MNGECTDVPVPLGLLSFYREESTKMGWVMAIDGLTYENQ